MVSHYGWYGLYTLLENFDTAYFEIFLFHLE